MMKNENKDNVAIEDFNRAIAEQQEIQKRNPFGSEAHKRADARIRELVKQHKGIDIGDYQ